MSKRKNEYKDNQDIQDVEDKSTQLKQIKQLEENNLKNFALHDQDSHSKDPDIQQDKQYNENPNQSDNISENYISPGFNIIQDQNNPHFVQYTESLYSELRQIVGYWCKGSSKGFYYVALDLVEGLSFYKNSDAELLDILNKTSTLISNIKNNHDKLTELLTSIQTDPPEGFIELVGNKFSDAGSDFLKGVLDATNTASIAASNSNNTTLEDLLLCDDIISSLYKIITTEVVILGEESL